MIKQLAYLLPRLRVLAEMFGREDHKGSAYYFTQKNYKDLRKILAALIKGEMKCIG